MTDFVLQESNNENLEKHLLHKNGHEFMNVWNAVFSYAQFLKQPLTLGMFIPCDLEGNVLEEPTHHGKSIETSRETLKEYQEAKDRVLFEGFEAIKWEHGGNSYSVRKNHGTDNEVQVCYYKAIPYYFVWSFDNIEQLTNKHLELTPTAQKQIGL